MKHFTWLCTLGILLVASCKEDKKDYTNGIGQQGTVAYSLKDDTLAGFLLGGIYIFQGYGGADKTFDKIRMEMHTKPGEDSFVNNLATVYRKLFEYPYHQSAKEKRDSRQVLQEWWDVHNEHEFHLLLTQLQEKGHQDLYLQIKKVVDENGGANVDTLHIDYKKYGLDPQSAVLISFVKRNYNEFGKQGIKAWDMARYVNVVCLGYGAEYIDRSTGLNYLMSILKDARSDYKDWNAYYKDFMLGRRFWGGDTTNNAVYQKTIDEMQKGDYSAYRYLGLK